MNLIIFNRFPSFYIVTSNMGFYCMYSISVWFAKFYFLFTQPWAATLRSSSPVGVNIALLVAGAPYSQCWCLCVWEFLDELTQLPKFKTKTNDEFSWRKLKKSHLNLYNSREVEKAWDIKCIRGIMSTVCWIYFW